MSTIHEALKKAQKDRDARRREQNLAPFSARPSRARAFRRAAWIMLLVLVVAVAAYELQSRFRAPVGDSRPAALPRQGAAAPEARAQAGGTPSPAAAFYEKARALHKQGLFRDAGRWYDKALAADPGHVDALNNLGVLLMRGGEMDRARELLEKAARLAPRSVDPLYNLACLHALAGDTAQGMAYLGRALGLDPAVRDWARGDEDLAGLRGSEEFQRLVGRSR
jgi:tetratricopeptide (TPR) repeat protein